MTNLEMESKIKLILYEKNKNEFEDFVIEVYRIEYPDIQSVKPQGQKGDGGNDGYVPNELVLQCYAPEHIDAKQTNDKIERDLNRAINSGWKFKEWHFVINDKFKGISRDIHHKIDELNDKYKDIEIKLIDSEILKAKILNNFKDSPYKVYNLLNYEAEINRFNDLNLLINTIDFIAQDSMLLKFNQSNAFVNFSLEKFNPDGQKKLQINIRNKDFLKLFGAFMEKSIEIVEEYKDNIDNFEEVGKIIKEIFLKFNKKFDSEISLQKTFNYFNNRNNKTNQNFQLALWIVIAYFFDICDIGDLPNGNG